MLRALALSALIVGLSSCILVSPTTYPDVVDEKHVRPDLRERIRHRLLWMGEEQPWHENCLFQKPISELVGGEQQLALPSADLMFRAYWEERRMAYRSAGFLYRQAADNGLALAYAKLGRLISEGLGTDPNPQGGAQLILQSARLQCGEGQYLYADILTRGQGVAPNLIEAWGWADQAAKQGHAQGLALKQKITALLGPSQLELARQNAETLARQLHLFNHGEQGKTLVKCKTDRNPTPFVTRMRACHAMGGTHIPY